jgi:hypothetical protein
MEWQGPAASTQQGSLGMNRAGGHRRRVSILHRYKKKVSCASLSHLNSLRHDSGRGRSGRAVRLAAEILQSARRSYSGLCLCEFCSSGAALLSRAACLPACKKAPGACRLFPPPRFSSSAVNFAGALGSSSSSWQPTSRSPARYYFPSSATS